MVAVVLLAHPGLAIAQDGEAEIPLLGSGLVMLGGGGGSHWRTMDQSIGVRRRGKVNETQRDGAERGGLIET